MTCVHHELSRGGTTLPPRTEAAGFTGVKQQQREHGAAQKRLLTSGGGRRCRSLHEKRERQNQGPLTAVFTTVNERNNVVMPTSGIRLSNSRRPKAGLLTQKTFSKEVPAL